jgi:hypothetical protein
MTDRHPARPADASVVEPNEPGAPQGYEPPAVVSLGRLAEITLGGIGGGGSDGTFSGSVISH